MPSPYVVILAGGSGTRFWPASRKQTPKQLLPLAPDSNEPLLVRTVRRVSSLCPPDHVIVATGEHLLEATRTALPWLPESSLLAEPLPRNTAPCIGWATSVVAARAPDATIMVLPSDQHIADEKAFLSALELALASAESGVITTVGVAPERPETGFGYIEVGERVSPGVHRVARFVEKPDRVTAEGYLASGRYVWNSGMFFFTARSMLRAIAEHMPELHRGLGRIAEAPGDAALTREVFAALPSVSIDYGVMEKEERLHVVPASFGWNDLGSWASAWDMSDRDENGNHGDGELVCIDARGNLVRVLGSAPKLVALVGVNDLCVIETDDVLLVMPRERAQDVKAVVDEVGKRGRTELL